MFLNFFSLLNIHFPFQKEIVSFLLWLDAVGYKIFSIFYKTFLKLAQQEIFKEDAFVTIYNNIYLILGVVALFLMAYMLLKMMINPDENKGSNEIKSMIIRFVVSIMMIALLPTFFGFLRDFQNALLEYNVVPKILLDTKIAIQQVDENGNYIGDQQFIDSNDINLTTEVMQYRANEMVASLVSGLMYPLKSDDASYDGEPADKKFDAELGTYRYYDANGSEWNTNVSEWWDGNFQAWTAGIGCAIGAGVLVLITVGTGGLGAIAGIGLGSAAIACVAGGGVLYGGGSLLAAIDAHHYTWTNALQAITLQGNYTQISLFAKAIVDGTFHYTPILSTIIVGILVYIMIGFCIDVVVRQAKLVFYQLLAPICFLISVNPKSKDLMSKWFKLVFTCWFEVFTRVFLLCAIVLLVGKLDLDRLTTIFHPIISTFIILGIVTFARQIPKIISDVTGIDSGNMKLNLKEKIAEGGGFVAASVIGSGTKMLSRGLTNTYKAAKDNYEYDQTLNGGKGGYKLKTGKSWKNVAGSVIGGLGKTATGTLRAQITGGINAKNAKSWKDTQNAKNTAVTSTEAAQTKTHKYIASHGGTVKGVAKGIGIDAIQGIKNYVGAKDEILAKVQAEDNYISAFDDYENLYADSGYRALDAQKDQYEAAINAGVGYGNMDLAATITAHAQAKERLTQMRMEAIATNKSGAAYVAYNLAKQVSENPDMANSIGASQELIRLAKSQEFILKKDKSGETKLYHKDGKTEWSTDELTNLFENKVASYTYTPNGKATLDVKTYRAGTIPKDQELYQSKKDVKQTRNNDKNSVTYKEAIKDQQRSNNNS